MPHRNLLTILIFIAYSALAFSDDTVPEPQVKLPFVIKFIGMQHGYQDDTLASQELLEALKRVTRHEIKIDSFERTTTANGGNQESLIDVTWHSEAITDCSTESVEKLLTTIKIHPSGLFTRAFKMHLSENFSYPQRVEVQWKGPCENLDRKRSKVGNEPSANTPATTTEARVQSTTLKPEVLSTTQEPIAPTTTQEPDASSTAQEADTSIMTKEPETATREPESTSTTQGNLMLDFEDFMKTNDTGFVVEESPTNTTREPETNSTTVKPEASGATVKNEAPVSTQGPEAIDSSPEPKPTTTTQRPDAPSTTQENDPFRFRQESKELEAISTTSSGIDAVGSMEAVTTTSGPNYGRYVGMVTAFFVLIGYLSYGAVHRRRSQSFDL